MGFAIGPDSSLTCIYYITIKGENCCDLDFTAPNVEVLIASFIENLSTAYPILKFLDE